MRGLGRTVGHRVPLGVFPCAVPGSPRCRILMPVLWQLVGGCPAAEAGLRQGRVRRMPSGCHVRLHGNATPLSPPFVCTPPPCSMRPGSLLPCPLLASMASSRSSSYIPHSWPVCTPIPTSTPNLTPMLTPALLRRQTWAGLPKASHHLPDAKGHLWQPTGL